MRKASHRIAAQALLGLAGMGLLGAPALWAQGKEAGQRGFQPTGSYQLSEIETLNTRNGNLLLSVPLASLPPGRAGEPGFRLSLNYNSKLRDFLSRHVWNSDRNAAAGDPHYIEEQQVGTAFGSPGWRYSYDYRIDLQDRASFLSPQHPRNCEPVPDVPERLKDYPSRFWHCFQLRMVFPDGSVHLFRPEGEDDLHEDTYFRVLPTGWRMKEYGHCKTVAEGWTAPDRSRKVTYYSVDGTYLRLDFEPDRATDRSATLIDIFKWQDNPWTLTFPDGRQVKGVGLSATRLLSRNANAVTVRRLLDNGGDPHDEIRDEAGRTLRIEPGSERQPEPNRQIIRQTGAGEQELTWTVEWGETAVNRRYAIKRIQRDETGGSISTTNVVNAVGFMHADLRMVTRVVLPSQLGGLDYRFTYNGAESNPSGAAYAPRSRGLGELRTVRTPWGATATYAYAQDYADTDPDTEVRDARAAAENTIKSKSLSYATGFGSQRLTENWTYRISPGSQAVITAPDRGKTRETYDAATGLLEKVERLTVSGGTETVQEVTERKWA